MQPTKDAAAGLPEGLTFYGYHGTADETVPVSHLGMFAKAFPGAIVRRLEGRDHQLNADAKDAGAILSSVVKLHAPVAERLFEIELGNGRLRESC